MNIKSNYKIVDLKDKELKKQLELETAKKMQNLDRSEWWDEVREFSLCAQFSRQTWWFVICG